MSKILRVIYVSVFEFFQMLPLTLQGLIVFSSIFKSAISLSVRAAIYVIVHRPASFLSDP